MELASYNSLLQNVRQELISLQQDLKHYNDAIINRCWQTCSCFASYLCDRVCRLVIEISPSLFVQ